MPTNIRDQVQQALGPDFVLTNELGGGGMSRVFVAREPSLDRDIVVKVLHPDLVTGASIDRFKREIQLAAQLQHPHIVPILSAGEVDGLPFLTMPFVVGLSLRQRLAEQGALPLDEAISVLRDVARALSFAHGRGVIHRDIKPDNVLLAEGSATVTDFGVAKAVNAAREAVPGGTLTSVGTSIGTPAYMSPEQAAGDPSTDHRTDIYAWGAMAFEVIAGRPLFTASSPHKLLAAHMSETPDLLIDHNPRCPQALSDLVARCLAKDAAARPQNASEILRALADVQTPGGHETLPAISAATRRTLGRALAIYAGAFVVVAALAQTAVLTIGLPSWVLPGTLIVMALGLPVVLLTAFVNHESRVARTVATRTPGGSIAPENSTIARLAVKASPHFTWRRTATGGVIAVGGFALLVVVFMAMRSLGIGPFGSLKGRGLLAENDRILVTDFQAPASDTSLGSVVSEGVRMGLAQSATFGVVPASQMAAALQRMQQPATAHVDLALARQMAEREGAKAIVDGKITPVASSFIITATLYATADSVPVDSYQETAKDATEIITAVDRVTRRVREKIGDSFRNLRQASPLERVTTASLPALRKYTEGFRHNAMAQNYPAAIASLEEAVALDSTFAIAMRQLASVYNNAGLRPGRVDSLRQQAFRIRESLPMLERSLIEGIYYSGGSHANRPLAMAAYRRALAADPRNPSALNSLANLHRDRREYFAAESLHKRTQAVAPEIPFSYTNLIPIQINMGNLEEAKKTHAEGLKRFPNNAQLKVAERLFAAAEFGAASDSAKAVCENVVKTAPAQQRVTGINCLRDIAAARGKLRESQTLSEQSVRERIQRGVTITESKILEAVDSAFMLYWWLDKPADAVRVMDDALRGRPVRDLAPDEDFYIDIATAYARAGAGAKAKAILAQYDADVKDSTRLRTQKVARLRAEADIAIADTRYADAVQIIQRADTAYDGARIQCDVCTSARLGVALDLAGETDKAIAAYESYLSSGWTTRLTDADWRYLGVVYKRLGELYDEKGDNKKASLYLSKFIDLWKDADPVLQPKVEDAKKRLAEIIRRSGEDNS